MSTALGRLVPTRTTARSAKPCDNREYDKKHGGSQPLRPQPSTSDNKPKKEAKESARAAAAGETPASASGLGGLHDTPIVLIQDNESNRDNPCAEMHRKLARSLLSAGFAKDLKPDADERRRLEAIVQKPPTTLLREEGGVVAWMQQRQLPAGVAQPEVKDAHGARLQPDAV